MDRTSLLRSSRRRRATSVAALAFLLASASLPLAATSAFAATPTVTTVAGPAQPVDVPDLAAVTVQITPAPQPQDGFTPAVAIYVDGGFSANEPIAADGTAGTSLALAAGTHNVYASFGGFFDYAASQSDPVSFEVGSATTTFLTSSREPALNTQAVTYTATVAGKYGYPQPADPPVGGTLTITDTTTSSLLGSLVVTADARTLAVTTKLPVGSHVLEAAYGGAGLFRASSVQLAETIQQDTAIDATSVTSTPATFYPIVDGYKDTLSIRGWRNEPISVAIRIYSVSTGSLVRSASVATGSGGYAWAWNGKSSSGVLQVAGSYRIVQTLTDVAANHKAFTTYATLSRKRLYEHSVTITKTGDAYSIYGDPGDGWVSRSASAYTRGVKLSSGHAWVAVSYPFTIPSATVYRTFTFKVLGRSTNGTHAIIAIWNPGWGSYQYVGNYAAAKSIGPSYAWWSTSGAGSALHSGRTARAEVYLEYGPGAKVFDVAKVSLVVRYAVLG